MGFVKGNLYMDGEKSRPGRRRAAPNLPENALALALAAADTKLEKTSLSAGASDVSYRLGAALLLKYAKIRCWHNKEIKIILLYDVEKI